MRLFSVLFGSILGLALLKFGNPVILDRLIEAPANGWELLFQAWPVRWGYLLLLVCVLLGIVVLKGGVGKVPLWVRLAPGVWLGWQAFSALGTTDTRLTWVTLIHFGACVACFYLGLYGLSRSTSLGAFWLPLFVAFLFALWVGFEQHYGGLEATRKMFYEQPNWQQYPPEYIKRIQTDRIFSTLVYPNAFAAAVLLLLAPMLLVLWSLSRRLRDPSRAVLVGVVGYAAVACLVWSGSKSGWLIGLVLLLALSLRQPLSKRLKFGIVALVFGLGLTAFFIRYAVYFRRGAPSVSARLEYWRAAVKTAAEHPLLGTGPGTFSVAYRKIKPPGAEMAQLAHNDYLEQASDSGLIGFVAYAGLILGSLATLAPKAFKAPAEPFAVWLGLLGWALQSWVEFLLYIPALAWTAFALLGWLWGRLAVDNQFDRVTGS